MYVIIDRRGYDAPEATGPFDTEADAAEYAATLLIDGGVVSTFQQAFDLMGDSDHMWVIEVLPPGRR